MADDRFDRHMSDEDALMWHIEKDPILRSTILALAIFDEAPDWRRLRARIERATHIIPRLRQRVVSPPFRIGPPRWTYEPTFDLDFHLRRMRLPAPGTHRQLLDALQPMAAASFDRARPLWEFTLIEGLQGPADSRAAFAMKVHHSVTDGVGGMELLAHLVDFSRDPGDAVLEDVVEEPALEDTSSLQLMRESVAHTQRRVFGIARRVPATAWSAARSTMRDPVGAASTVTNTVRSVARTLAPATAPMSPVMVDRGLGRRLDTFDVALDDLRRSAKATGGSLNDVFVAAVLGGLRGYHARHGAAPNELRMTLPINLRQRGDVTAGNRFAPARFAVPADLDDPRDRVEAIGALVRSWRSEPALQMTGTLAGVLNRLPTATTTALFGSMLKCCDFVTTNVPGAPVPVFAGGAEVERMYAFAPPSGAAVNVSLISHCDTCCIGVVSDTTAIPDPDLLVSCLRSGFDELLSLGWSDVPPSIVTG
jgi:WS/DGAT/MGAT family acyltransferase